MQAVASTKTNAQGQYTHRQSVGGSRRHAHADSRDLSRREFSPAASTGADHGRRHDLRAVVRSENRQAEYARCHVPAQRSEPAQSWTSTTCKTVHSRPWRTYNANGNFEFRAPRGRTEFPGFLLGAVAHARQSGHHQSGARGSSPSPTPFSLARTACASPISCRTRRTRPQLKLVSANGAERVGLIAPASVQIESAGFTPQGQEQGFNFYSRDAIPAGTSFEVTVSGAAAPPAADPGAGQPGAGGGAACHSGTAESPG